ncbi:hypothetical protein ARMSODRAFT_602487 [Armillaria solidipes]|uniref:Secreted protein n=1 Tax=Armillaria solidipes TaxID=1076256 RepID=A0A2H3B0T1_9AGAR|nr:hypothetical protein ARMSODRAFT_602487 [Armillaria solidipes]
MVPVLGMLPLFLLNWSALFGSFSACQSTMYKAVNLSLGYFSLNFHHQHTISSQLCPRRHAKWISLCSSVLLSGFYTISKF